jgi:hypothetical protein
MNKKDLAAKDLNVWARPQGNHGARIPSVRWALAGLSLSTLLSSLGTSIANVGLPKRRAGRPERFGHCFENSPAHRPFNFALGLSVHAGGFFLASRQSGNAQRIEQQRN